MDSNGHALLVDFGLLTIMSDPTNSTVSNLFAIGGAIRWMSQELFLPRHAWRQGCSTDKTIRLLRIGDGYLRGPQRSSTFRTLPLLCRYAKSHRG